MKDEPPRPEGWAFHITEVEARDEVDVMSYIFLMVEWRSRIEFQFINGFKS